MKGIESIEGYERYTFCTLRKLGFFLEVTFKIEVL